jgi:putative cell wall-binding protein
VLSVHGVSWCPDQRAAIEECVRVTKPGGTILLSLISFSASVDIWYGDQFWLDAKIDPTEWQEFDFDPEWQFDGCDTVVVTTGANWPDALGGTALAGAHGAPILLSAAEALPASTAREIDRLGATKVIVLGGESAVGGSVTQRLEDMVGKANVRRLSGTTRYTTASLIAREAVAEQGAAFDGTAFVVTGERFPDALSAAPLAVGRGWPIYLASSGVSALLGALGRDGVTDVIILGGTESVSLAHQEALEQYLGSENVVRIGGSDRYDTSRLLAKHVTEHRGANWTVPLLTTGESFPDGLAGGTLPAAADSVMLLTAPNLLPPRTASLVRGRSAEIDRVVIIGGTRAVATSVRTELASMLE